MVNKSDQASNGKGKEKEKTGHAAERPDLDMGKPRNDKLEGTDNAKVRPIGKVAENWGGQD